MAVAKDKEKDKSTGFSMMQIIREVRSELRKVVWPTRQETVRLTIVVITISVLIGVFLSISDTIFLSLYSLLTSVAQ
jgi:preprotein translocase subunit SecE